MLNISVQVTQFYLKIKSCADFHLWYQNCCMQSDQQQTESWLSMEILNKQDQSPEVFMRQIVTGDDKA